MFLDTLQPFVIALLIGLAVGIDRERQTADAGGTMGVRTFALVALLGAIAGRLAVPALTASLVLALAAMTIAGYLRTTQQRPPAEPSGQDAPPVADHGLTSEISAAVVFALGYLANGERLLAGILGTIAVTVLYSRHYLHAFSRDVLRPADIRAAVSLGVMAIVVMPLLPDEALDRWGLFNPRQLAQIVVLLSAIEFGGYIVERLAGARVGALATGFFGGLASSTAVLVGRARLSRQTPEEAIGAAAAALAATMATLLLFVAIVVNTAPALLVSVGLPALAAAAVAGAGGALMVRRGAQKGGAPGSGGKSPLDLGSVLKLGAFVFGLVVLTTVVRRRLGVEAVGLVSFVSGLFELHATTYAGAALFGSGELPAPDATRMLMLAALASMVSKLAISWTLGGRRFALLVTAGLLASTAAGAAVMALAAVAADA